MRAAEVVRWHRGPELRELGDAQPYRVEACGRPFVVVAGVDRLYAVAEYCTHARWSLAEVGEVDDGEIECTAHGARFDLMTGAVLCLPATRPLEVAEVRVHDGRVELGVVCSDHDRLHHPREVGECRDVVAQPGPEQPRQGRST